MAYFEGAVHKKAFEYFCNKISGADVYQL